MDATHRSNGYRGDIFVYLDKKEDNMANELVTINDQAIIDEYYRNGFIGYKAVLKVKPDVTQKWAGTYFNAMMKKLALAESWQPKRMKAVRFSLINLPG